VQAFFTALVSERLHELVVPGGQLILASPFTWLGEYTREREWLKSSDVPRLLEPHFRLARRRDFPSSFANTGANINSHYRSNDVSTEGLLTQTWRAGSFAKLEPNAYWKMVGNHFGKNI